MLAAERELYIYNTTCKGVLRYSSTCSSWPICDHQTSAFSRILLRLGRLRAPHDHEDERADASLPQAVERRHALLDCTELRGTAGNTFSPYLYDRRPLEAQRRCVDATDGHLVGRNTRRRKQRRGRGGALPLCSCAPRGLCPSIRSAPSRPPPLAPLSPLRSLCSSFAESAVPRPVPCSDSAAAWRGCSRAGWPGGTPAAPALASCVREKMAQRAGAPRSA